MPLKLKSNGYFEIEYSGPYLGLNVQEPENLMDDRHSPFTNNFQFRNAELRSRPNFQLEFAGMDNINQPLGTYSFLDVNGIQHTVGWNSRGLWQFAPSGQPSGASTPWAILGGPQLVAGNPVSYRAFANILYYTNGGPQLVSWDGITLTPTASNAGVANATSVAAISVADAPTVVPGSTGPLSIGGLYLGELDNHILLANVTVLDNGTGVTYTFPQRMWWSANGIPTQWDPAANTNAGENDFLDVPDLITGLITIGVSGYLFRSNGITFFTPSGNGLAPFQFDHLWASDHGIGNVYPWSIHAYGSIACFISTEQIYQMGVSSFEPIGGKARDAIMADLALASGNPVASIVPTDGLGYVYLTYRIAIPLPNFTRHYIYSIEDKNWAVWDTPGLLQTGRCEEVWTGTLSNFGGPGIVPPATGKAGGGTAPSGSGTFSGGGGITRTGCPMVGTVVQGVGSVAVWEIAEESLWTTIAVEAVGELTATQNHLVYSQRGKVMLKDLVVGDLLVTESGERPVLSVNSWEGVGKKMCVEVPDGHLYWASGILSHNIKPNIN